MYLPTRRSARSRICIVSRAELVSGRRTRGVGQTSWTGDERALGLELIGRGRELVGFFADAAPGERAGFGLGLRQFGEVDGGAPVG